MADSATNEHANTRMRVMLSACGMPSACCQLRYGGGYVAIVSHQDMKCRNVFGTIVVAVLAPSICTYHTFN